MRNLFYNNVTTVELDRVELWIDELESGKWLQIRDRLRENHSGRCCLGVAADVYIRNTGLAYWDGEELVSDDDCSSTGLTGLILEWFGIEPDSESVYFYDEELQLQIAEACKKQDVDIPVSAYNVSLVSLNDALRWDFMRIAALLREEVKECRLRIQERELLGDVNPPVPSDILTP